MCNLDLAIRSQINDQYNQYQSLFHDKYKDVIMKNEIHQHFAILIVILHQRMSY